VLVDEDSALVEAARAGDRAAFSSLFERHHRRVFAMCSRLLRDAAEVEDAVQQTFLEGWRSLHRFEGRSRFSTWITRIAIHTCLGFRRRLKRLFVSDEPPEDGGTGDLGWGTPPMAPDEGAVHARRRRAVDEVLQRLSAKKRVVFVLAELEGMTAPEISRILEVPDATVRTRLFHARKEFLRHAQGHPGFADVLDAPSDGEGEL
jgi:RNA polymerase sigma-70 factor (ECF subfamily)